MINLLSYGKPNKITNYFLLTAKKLSCNLLLCRHWKRKSNNGLAATGSVETLRDSP